MTARDIEKALISKYREKYVCVPQCKTGATHKATGLGIIDMWVMAKSWAHPRVMAFEIKISRSDFLNDTKWPGYLEYCNEFYFVVPSLKIATPEEMPDGVGLMVVSTTGNVIYTKRKAAYRDAPISESVYRYILMCRARIDPEYREPDKAAYWRNWLVTKEVNHELGYRVSEELRRAINDEIEKAREENKRVRRENENLQEIKDSLVKAGIEWRRLSSWNAPQTVTKRLEEFESGLSTRTRNDIETCISALQRIQEVTSEPA
jgi:hypothetical protein